MKGLNSYEKVLPDSYLHQLHQRVADALIEEACRQWCDFISEAPERLTGKGFADFHREIVEQKYFEYETEISELMEHEHSQDSESLKHQLNM